MLPALARFFQGFSNQTPEAEGLNALYLIGSAGDPPAWQMTQVITAFAVMDAFLLGRKL